ncbi:MAG: hypothetical protein R3Y27_04075 [Clostridia bacterium]
MKVAIIGSRGLDGDIPEELIPRKTTQIISGGAVGVDTKTREFALSHGIQILEILPDYDLYGKSAPILRNNVIVDASDLVIAFWDGKSRGTGYVINRCLKVNKSIIVYKMTENGYEEHMSEVHVL